MKKIMCFIFFGLTCLSYAQAQTQYTNGNISVNGSTYRVHVTSLFVSFNNIQNNLGDVPLTNPDDFCGMALYDKPSMTIINNVFRNVFPASKRATFRDDQVVTLFVIANGAGNSMLNVAFEFKETAPITPAEINQLEIGLKALNNLVCMYSNGCTGVNYRVTNMPIHINKL